MAPARLFDDGSDEAPKLVGIARMASESELLEGKRRVEYRDLGAKSYISRCPNPQLPFRWTINPYRGCEFGCKYCYARYTHEFMELRDGSLFETRIFAKQWNPAAFRAELLKLPYGETIALGTATDPYQPAERRYEISRKMLEEFVRMPGMRLWITTKSDLVERDIELLKKIAEHSLIHVNMTVTTMDAKLARRTEPFAPRPELRMAAVAALRKAGIDAGVSLSPILPLITDTEESIDAVVKAASQAGALWVWHNVLFLRSCARAVFLPFLEAEVPHLINRYRARYQNSDFIRGPYLEVIKARVERARLRNGLDSGEARREVQRKKPAPALEPQLKLAL
ncbi:MAG TPA: radical SAM protein [Bryobacteraceae bacterium]